MWINTSSGGNFALVPTSDQSLDFHIFRNDLWSDSNSMLIEWVSSILHFFKNFLQWKKRLENLNLGKSDILSQGQGWSNGNHLRVNLRPTSFDSNFWGRISQGIRFAPSSNQNSTMRFLTRNPRFMSILKAQNLSFFSESSTKTFETVADRQIVRLSTLSLDRIDEGCLDRMTIFYLIFAKTRFWTSNNPLKGWSTPRNSIHDIDSVSAVSTFGPDGLSLPSLDLRRSSQLTIPFPGESTEQKTH